jgi:hypothetical protein
MKQKYYARRRRARRTVKTRFFIIIGLLVAALAVGIFFIVRAITDTPGSSLPPSESVQLTPPESSGSLPTEGTTPTEEPTPTPAPSLAVDLVPAAVEDTQPSKFGFETHVYVDNEETTSYTRSGSVSLPTGAEYTALEGVTTYRGNNYRDASSWGTADITNGKLNLLTNINKTTGKIGRWGGSGCTGQPLVVTWPDKTREKMTSLYDEFKSKQGFTEVIMASLDGNIYFMELSTGAKTRDPIKIGAPTKGTPSLDPRGYPIIYVGQGLNPEGSDTASNDMYVRAYSLIDGKLLYSFGAKTKDPYAVRGWQAYDASPLVDAATDTLIEPGENGILYTVKLNTQYDEEAGTLTMSPEPIVKYTYTSTRNKSSYGGTGVWGMENSPAGWRNYLFFTDNIGMLQCVDLNTMKLVYANDLENDSDVSMVLEEDIANQGIYLYTGCEYDDTVANATETTGTCYARKINGLTGEILWSRPFTVYTAIDGSVDGGILASPILGKEGTTMEGLIIYTVSSVIKDDGTKTAMVVALDKETGDIKWQVDMENSGWTPASPVPVYTADGQGYIVQCLYGGEIKLIKVDGDTASVSDSVNVGEKMGTEEPNNFEATPVVFGNTIVVGSRSSHFFFLTIN